MSENRSAPVWMAVILGAMAAGMGWGIRGQYGHETGAMIAGVLFGLVTVFLFGAHLSSLSGARAAALCALGVSIGGSMTYGSTLGLTQDAALIGNWEALRWGMLGVAIKGSIWIGFCGTFFGMGLSRVRYRPLEVILLLLVMVFLFFAGVAVINSPYDPEHRVLPNLYFSDNWYFEPDGDVKPRFECWGGLYMALTGLVLYVGVAKDDRLALRLAFWGMLGGALGFPGGQCIQASHAWNPEFYQRGIFTHLPPQINWWNMMETAFGAIWGAVLALGIGLNRHLIGPKEDADTVEITPAAEWALVAVHVVVLVSHEFHVIFESRLLDIFMSHSLTMVLIPVTAVLAGRYWPYLMTLPILAVPITGKTVRTLWFSDQPLELPLWYGVLGYIVLPLTLATLLAVLLARRGLFGEGARPFARWSLLLATWTYFWLNTAVFQYPRLWDPVKEWSSRTPNAAIFTVCATCLTLAALFYGWSKRAPEASEKT